MGIFDEKMMRETWLMEWIGRNSDRRGQPEAGTGNERHMNSQRVSRLQPEEEPRSGSFSLYISEAGAVFTLQSFISFAPASASGRQRS